MPAYVIIEIEVTDPVEFEEYKKLTPATISAYDGKFVVRGGKTELLEGDWRPERIVVLEFPSAARAREWWHSEEYTKAKVIRQRTAKTKMLVVEGVV